MNKILLNAERINEYGHHYLKEVLSFPDYYGNNLDALYDCLSELPPMFIEVYNYASANAKTLQILAVFQDVSDDYQNICVQYN